MVHAFVTTEDYRPDKEKDQIKFRINSNEYSFQCFGISFFFHYSKAFIIYFSSLFH